MATDDHMIPPPLHAAMAKRAGSTVAEIEVIAAVHAEQGVADVVHAGVPTRR